jgi:hypothetical protein
MSEPDTIEGQCLCGAVRFALRPPLEPVTLCHCRSCRLSRGAAFVAWTSVPTERFAFVAGEAEVSWYRSSRQIRWGFCRNCGSSMFYVADEEGHPEAPAVGHVYVSLGSVTSQVGARPVAHVSYEESVPWLEGSNELPKYRGKTGERMDE